MGAGGRDRMDSRNGRPPPQRVSAACRDRDGGDDAARRLRSICRARPAPRAAGDRGRGVRDRETPRSGAP